ncbi:major paralogous domain-containing protein [Dyadobacter sp. SG02]|uniref:FISUMP domain-containing protein n=1 Tax=Dyadobacter sp. SG02 TaxID=1855291 RepID=UPI0008C952D1|nr:FISUMP domain-containing protein [Dyadobacter sp. SG02]SEJ57808.1 major paralogous domain-containing protein [Dyadobacter sp. SG02]
MQNSLLKSLLIICICIMTGRANCQTAGTISDRDGNTYTVKLMPDGNQWMTQDLNIRVDSSWCFGDDPANCKIYGRLYTYFSAPQACEMLGDGWRLPSRKDWEVLSDQYGGASNKSKDWGRAAYKALQTGGESGFNATLGGNREFNGGKYERLNGHGFYWTTTEIDTQTAWNYNFGAGGKALHCQDGMGKQEGASVRCVRTVAKN